MDPSIVTIWIEPLPHSDLVSLWWRWERPGVRVIEMPGLLMPPSDARQLIETLTRVSESAAELDRVTITLR